MSTNDPCRRFLSELGFQGDDIDNIMDNLRDIESVNQYAKEVHGKLKTNQKLAISMVCG